eukprot:NODE_1572_length_1489_cov_40.668750_g1418_i0.p1 GENE.NODE_1572_length_1489_cov_40.668750_g1418_i0~~NODE_1572_length_1489_cov_40.668750_g1418_i0.p1  ORF type:complete len:380 (-),score=76.19 NODE_1572_length_1489_cov_40.668750_g1418_i0:220-1359(-)
MWEVLRRQQGEEYEAAPPTKGDISENLRHIARFECKPNVKPFNPHDLTEPYEARLFPKIVSNLTCEDSILRRKAARAMVEYFGQRSEHIVSAIEANAIPALVSALRDQDVAVRVDACVALTRIVQTPKGQQAILSDGWVPSLKAAVHDEPEVAVQALRLLTAMDSSWNSSAGTDALIKAGCIELYIEQARTSVYEVKVEALCALEKVTNVKEAFVRVLSTGAMSVLTDLLKGLPDPVVQHAAENIALLCFFSAGKRAAVEDPATTIALIDHMLHPNTALRCAVTSALMGITVDNNGKELMLAHHGVDRLAEALGQEGDAAVLTNLLKTTCNVSENPGARAALAAALPSLEQIVTEHEAAGRMSVVNSARRAIDGIRWTP